MIKDHMPSFNLKPHTIEIANPLIVAFKSSPGRYEIHLEEEKKKTVTKAEKNTMHIAADIDKFKVKQGQLERAVEMIKSEFVECIRLAEDKEDMLMFIKDLDVIKDLD